MQNFRSRSGSHNGEAVTQEDVKDAFNNLYALKENGQILRKWMDDVEGGYNGGAIRPEEVACNMPARSATPIIQAASTAKHNAAPKSLLEKLTGLTINTHKKMMERRSHKNLADGEQQSSTTLRLWPE